MNRLEILQKRVIRIIFNLPFREHTNHYFVSGNFLKVKDLIFLNSCKIMHKAFHGKLPHNIQKLYVINARHPLKFIINYTRTCQMSHNIINSGVKLWNNLDNNLKLIPNLKQFSVKLKNIILEKYKTID